MMIVASNGNTQIACNSSRIIKMMIVAWNGNTQTECINSRIIKMMIVARNGNTQIACHSSRLIKMMIVAWNGNTQIACNNSRISKIIIVATPTMEKQFGRNDYVYMHAVMRTLIATNRYHPYTIIHSLSVQEICTADHYSLPSVCPVNVFSKRKEGRVVDCTLL